MAKILWKEEYQLCVHTTTHQQESAGSRHTMAKRQEATGKWKPPVPTVQTTEIAVTMKPPDAAITK